MFQAKRRMGNLIWEIYKFKWKTQWRAFRTHMRKAGK